MAVHDTMLHDHSRIEQLLDEVLEAANADDRDRLRKQWLRLEAVLLAHFDTEELYMIPGLSKHDPARAAQILEDHARIRDVIGKVGVGLELHAVRAAHLAELSRRVREHARDEEVDFYRWADEALPESTRAAVRARVKGA